MTGMTGNTLRIDLDPGSPIFCLTELWFSLKSTISEILGFSMEAMGDPMGTPWDPMGSHGTPWDPWGPMGTHGNPWEPMGTHGNPWGPMGTHGFPLVLREPMCFPYGARLLFQENDPPHKIFFPLIGFPIEDGGSYFKKTTPPLIGRQEKTPRPTSS